MTTQSTPRSSATINLNHLRRGGFVLVDNCCGPEPFDRTFRELMAQVLPDAPLRRLPADHAIFLGEPGFDVRPAAHRPP